VAKNTGEYLARAPTELIGVQNLELFDKARLQASTELTKKVAKVTHSNNND
jgi:hypothetical protein